MAGEWLAYDLALPQKPEVLELVDATGLETDQVVPIRAARVTVRARRVVTTRAARQREEIEEREVLLLLPPNRLRLRTRNQPPRTALAGPLWPKRGGWAPGDPGSSRTRQTGPWSGWTRPAGSTGPWKRFCTFPSAATSATR
jgi:hypothetical protein